MNEEETNAIEILKSWAYYHVEEIKEDFDTVNNAITTILDLYNKEKEQNKKLKTLLYQIRNELRYKIIIQEDGIYKPCKNLTKQEVYESFVKLNLMLKANYVFKNNEKAIEELLKEGEKE